MIILGECITTVNTKIHAWLRLYQRAPTIAKFTFTVVNFIRHDSIRSARTKVDIAFLPFEATIVDNANGDFAVHLFDGIENRLQHSLCKANTRNNSSCN